MELAINIALGYLAVVAAVLLTLAACDVVSWPVGLLLPAVALGYFVLLMVFLAWVAWAWTR